MLIESDAPVLVLNACRSSYVEAPSTPVDVMDQPADMHAQVRALGSLAQEVMDAGAAGVVAMRYNVYVVTAAQFARWYALTGGATGEAEVADEPADSATRAPRAFVEAMGELGDYYHA